MVVQPGLCQTWSESTLLVFSRCGSFHCQSIKLCPTLYYSQSKTNQKTRALGYKTVSCSPQMNMKFKLLKNIKQELRRGRYHTCIWWNNYSVQYRSSKKRAMVCAWRVCQGQPLCKGTRSWYLVVKCIKDNYYARFRTPSYQCCREMYIISILDLNFDKVSGAWNVCQGNRFMMCAWRMCQGQLLCKLSYPMLPMLPLLQRNALHFYT